MGKPKPSTLTASETYPGKTCCWGRLPNCNFIFLVIVAVALGGCSNTSQVTFKLFEVEVKEKIEVEDPKAGESSPAFERKER